VSAAPEDLVVIDRQGHDDDRHQPRILSWRRLLVCLAGGLVAAAAVVLAGAPALSVLAGSTEQDPLAVVSVVLGVLVVVLSWALVNTVFALKYARLYYEGGDGGIDFKQDQPPTYSDFAYLAFTVGMSFAVSETEPVSTAVRKVALGHALMSYLFGTIVIAVAVNLVTNLGQS
jgi:uncharacterized membrane protein